jgi:hypothetical protein
MHTIADSIIQTCKKGESVSQFHSIKRLSLNNRQQSSRLQRHGSRNHTWFYMSPRCWPVNGQNPPSLYTSHFTDDIMSQQTPAEVARTLLVAIQLIRLQRHGSRNHTWFYMSPKNWRKGAKTTKVTGVHVSTDKPRKNVQVSWNTGRKARTRGPP